MTTGYEVQMYNDIADIKRSLQRIAYSLEIIAEALDKPLPANANEKLRKAMRKKGMSQRLLAERLRIGQSTFSEMMTGKRVFDGEMLSKIAAMLDVSVESLMEDEKSE